MEEYKIIEKGLLQTIQDISDEYEKSGKGYSESYNNGMWTIKVENYVIRMGQKGFEEFHKMFLEKIKEYLHNAEPSK